MSANASPRAVLVTGGTGGIGAALADAFARLGDQVTVTGRTAAEVDAYLAKHPQADAIPLDVGDAQAIAEVVSSRERVDVLVNAAGMIARHGTEFEPGTFEQVLDVNLTGIMRMATACRSRLEASKGCILNLASMLSFFGSAYVPAYSASKGGVVQLTRSLAIAWAPHIRVNALAPGWIETALTRPLVDNPDRSREIVSRTPLGRWGQPEDVTGPALFLCSSEARFITGAVLPVDGGYSVA